VTRSPRASRSGASLLVRKLGRAAAAEDPEAQQRHRLSQKASEGFKLMMRRLEAAYGGAAYGAAACGGAAYGARQAEPGGAGRGAPPPPPLPDDFKERLDHWRDYCGLPRELHERMQRLRIWRNASEHGDAQRWRREGPRDEGELEQMLKAVDTLAEQIRT
jgi:hypothetical protein